MQTEALFEIIHYFPFLILTNSKFITLDYKVLQDLAFTCFSSLIFTNPASQTIFSSLIYYVLIDFQGSVSKLAESEVE